MKLVLDGARNKVSSFLLLATLIAPSALNAGRNPWDFPDDPASPIAKKRAAPEINLFPSWGDSAGSKRSRVASSESDSSSMFDDDSLFQRIPLAPRQAATTIQSAFRGFQLRKELRHIRYDGFTNYMNQEASFLSYHAGEVQKQIDLRFQKGMISLHEFVHELDELALLAVRLRSAIADLQDSRQSPPIQSSQALESYADRVGLELASLRVALGQFIARYGLNSLTQTIAYHLGGDWNTRLSSATATQVDSFERYFSVTETTLVELTDIGDGDFLLSDGDDIRETLHGVELNDGQMIVRKISSSEKQSVAEMQHGIEFIIPIKTDAGVVISALMIRGVFAADPLNTIALDPVFSGYYHALRSALAAAPVPRRFKDLFFQNRPLRDLLVESAGTLREKLVDDYKAFRELKDMSVQETRTRFLAESVGEQIRTLSLLLMQEKDDFRPVLLLQQAQALSASYVNVLKQGLHYTVLRRLLLAEDDIEKMRQRLESMRTEKIPFETLILTSSLSEELKAKALDRAKEAAEHGVTASKAQAWLNAVLKLPIGKEVTLPVSLTDDPQLIKGFMTRVRLSLDQSAYGHKKAKKEIERIAGQWISRQGSAGEVLALEGPPGNGKTSLGKGVAEALGLPFVYLPLGGATDSAYMVGHDYTYVGSSWGKIADAFMKSKSETFVLFIDEIDKISASDKGLEISNILTHFLDPEGEIEDKYFETRFSGKKLLIILACNDASLIPPILRDRIRIVRTDPLLKKDKIVIGQQYLLPKILEEVGFKSGEITIDKPELDYLASTYTHDAGARELKRLLFSIVREQNLQRLIGAVQLPIRINREIIDACIKKPARDFTVIPLQPLVGTVNGLFATTAGGGGITVIQAFKNPNSHALLDLELTGSQGDVMKESMKAARTVAWNLLPKREQAKIIAQKTFGLHLHCPDTSMPKDGPSAGGAITLAMVSRLLGIAIKNDVAMTGEIDLNGNITKIGGLHFKMMGAKRAGVKKVFYPRENQKDVDKIRKTDPELIDDLSFSAQAIDTIYDLLTNCLVDTSTPFQVLNN